MARAVIQFVGQLNKYSVYMLDQGTPQEVAKLFEHTGLTNEKASSAWKLRASEVATKFLRIASHGVLTERGCGNPPDEFTYVVNVPQLKVTVLDGKRISVFSGSLAEFGGWSDGSAGLKNAIDKVVKFHYQGGSGFGKQRIVKLKSVTGEGKKMLLKGWDVVQSTGEKPAYRTYRMANVVGKIEIVG